MKERERDDRARFQSNSGALANIYKLARPKRGDFFKGSFVWSFLFCQTLPGFEAGENAVEMSERYEHRMTVHLATTQKQLIGFDFEISIAPMFS